jgi:protein-serine/threonine kinase
MGYNDDNSIKESQSSRTNTLVGTEEYLAPETLSDQGELSYSCDYWSMGVIMYQLLNGVTPFKGRSDLETYHNIQKCHDIKFLKPSIDPKAKDLI